MSTVKINLLGLGSAKITNGQKTIYIDAFVDEEHWERLPFFPVEQADLLLFTHADGDHFCPKITAQVARETGAMVVGPPSLAYPLLADEKLPPEQLHVVYPVHFKEPITEEIRGISLKTYQTKHFLDWEPPHVSYLVELDGKKLYHTGDSAMLDEDDPDLHQLDVLIYNLVSLEKDLAHIAVLEDAYRTFQPRYLLPAHLIRCEWTYSIPDVKKEVKKRGLENVVLLEDEQQIFEIS